MNRRGFFGLVGAATAAALVPKWLADRRRNVIGGFASSVSKARNTASWSSMELLHYDTARPITAHYMIVYNSRTGEHIAEYLFDEPTFEVTITSPLRLT